MQNEKFLIFTHKITFLLIILFKRKSVANFQNISLLKYYSDYTPKKRKIIWVKCNKFSHYFLAYEKVKDSD